MFQIISTLNIILFLALFHPLHISLTSVEYSDDGKLVTSIKIFRDDFETIIQNNYKIKLNTTACIYNYEDSVAILNYINSNFSMKFDSKYEFEYTEISEIKCNNDAVWFVNEQKNVSNFESIELENTLMLDLYPDQKNLFIFKSNQVEKGFELDEKNTQIKIEFKQFVE